MFNFYFSFCDEIEIINDLCKNLPSFTVNYEKYANYFSNLNFFTFYLKNQDN